MGNVVDMPHPAEHSTAARSLGADEAADLAETLKALASSARLRLLTELLTAERTVESLAAAAELSLSATSHHCASCARCGSCVGDATGGTSTTRCTTTTW